jgi:hypothetical protein
MEDQKEDIIRENSSQGDNAYPVNVQWNNYADLYHKFILDKESSMSSLNSFLL